MSESRLEALQSLVPPDSFDALTLRQLLLDYGPQYSGEGFAALLLNSAEEVGSVDAMLYAARAIRYFRSPDDKAILLSTEAIRGAIKLMAWGDVNGCTLEDRYSVLHDTLCPDFENPKETAEGVLAILVDAGDGDVAKGIVRMGVMDQQRRGARVRLPWQL
jgi:hypothetical protein